MFWKKKDPHAEMKIKLAMFLWVFSVFIALLIISKAEVIFAFIVSLFR